MVNDPDLVNESNTHLALKQLGRKSSFYGETKLVGCKLSTEATALNRGVETGIASE